MNDENPSRRRVLRGALALGCGLSAPFMLAGCEKKKSAEPAMPGPAAPPATPSPAAAPPSTPPAPAATSPSAGAGKLAKSAVQYQEHPNGDQQCAGCLHFIPESNTCKLVDGPISPTAWCVLWVKKA